jgi:IS30 family transposase
LYPGDAEKQARARKARHKSKVERISGFKAYMIDKLQRGWAPGAIAGRWSRDNPEQPITAETIYKFIYSKEGRILGLLKYLPRKKKRRGMQRKSRAASLKTQERISIHDRPKSIETRNESGHFESDLVFYKNSRSQNILTIIERKSRKLFAVKQESKHSKMTRENMINSIGSYAKTVTTDNGTEFSDFTSLNKQGIATFFCDPGSPWQKGSIEHANGLLRRFLPFSLPASSVTQDALQSALSIINNIPRKSLNFLTPNEQFSLDYNKKI